MSSPANETFHAFAKIGSSTERGGRVSRVTTSAHCEGHALARIGDFVLYKDGSEATIIDRAGVAATWEDKPLALVGSHLSNADTIIESLQNKRGIVVRHDDPMRGLFDPDHIVQETATEARGHDA